MHRVHYRLLASLLGLLLAACANQPATPPPSGDADAVATAPAATPPAPTPESPAPSADQTQTYRDPELGFSLRYDASWHLEAKPGSGLAHNDGRGRTVWLSKGGYMFQLGVADGPGRAEGCAGAFDQDPADLFWVYQVDGVELWRIKAERGAINGYHDQTLSFISVISPLALYAEPSAQQGWGTFTCEPQINNHGVSLQYQLPVSLADLQAGRFDQGILSEMDQILISLTWRQ